MAGRDQILRLGGIVDGVENGFRAIASGNSGGNSGCGIDRNCKCSTKWRSVIGNHHGNAEMSYPLLSERKADQTTPVRRYEIDRFGSDFLGRHAKIAFVLAVFVIHENDHSATSDFIDGFFNTG